MSECFRKLSPTSPFITFHTSTFYALLKWDDCLGIFAGTEEIRGELTPQLGNTKIFWLSGFFGVWSRNLDTTHYTHATSKAVVLNATEVEMKLCYSAQNSGKKGHR